MHLDIWATLQNISLKKNSYVGFKLQLMLEIHVRRVYSTYFNLLTVRIKVN